MSIFTPPTNSIVDDRPDRLEPLAVLLVAVLIGVALFLTGFWVGSARGGSERDAVTHARSVPDWFLPIWDAYDRNPKVTPETDFAMLYESRPQMLARAAEEAIADVAKLRASRAARHR